MVRWFRTGFITWICLHTSYVYCDLSCEIINKDNIELVAQEQIKIRLADYPVLYQHVAKFFSKNIFKKVMEGCMTSGCNDRTDLFQQVHIAVEKHMRPLRWSSGAVLLFSTSAAAYLTTIPKFEGPYGEIAKLGFGFVTLASAASLAYWHAPLQASVTRLSYAMFGPRLQPTSDGFVDALGDRGYRSKEHALYRQIGIRWNAAMDNIAVTGWFRFTGFLGSAGNARGMIKDMADTFEKPSQKDMEFLAHRTARFMADARSLPGAIPFNNAKIMTELQMTLWPSIGKHQDLIPAYVYMVKRSLEYWDPQYKLSNPDSVASLYYNAFLRAWKVDGTPVPKTEIVIRPPEGLFKEFDRLGRKEQEKDLENIELANKKIQDELELNENKANEQQLNELGAQPAASNLPEPSQNQVDPTSGASQFENPSGG